MDIIEKYYNHEKIYSHQILAYHHLLDTIIPNIFSNIIVDCLDKRISFKNPTYKNVCEDNGRFINVQECILRGKTYEIEIYGDIHENDIIRKGVYFFKIPLMIGTRLCNSLFDNVGGYFIIGGKERVIVAQERMCYNIPIVYMKADTIISEMRSFSSKTNHSIKIQIIMKKSNENTESIGITNVYFIAKTIPIGIFFKAFGFSILEWINFIGETKYTSTFVYTSFHEVEDYSQETALSFLGDGNVEYGKQLLNVDIFPHSLDGKNNHQIFAYMCFKLLQSIEYNSFGEKDHLKYKRLDMIDLLMYELIYSQFKKTVYGIQSKMNKKHSDFMFHMSQVNLISEKILKCFLTGNWGIVSNNYIKVGVSQMINRINDIGALAHMNRIISPLQKMGKNLDARQIHPSQYGFLCTLEVFTHYFFNILDSRGNISRISEISLYYDKDFNNC